MKKLTFYIFLLCGLSFNSYAQIAVWNFFGENSPATSAADTFNAGLDSSNLITRGPGAAASLSTNSFRTTGFQNNGIAVTNNDYFQITLSATAGNSLSLSTIDANFGGTATFYAAPGVSSQFAYSLDGTNFTLIGSPQLNSTLPLVLTQINLSGIAALQNVPAATTITLRYYASGQTTTGGWGFNSSSATVPGLSINGVIAPSGKASNGTGGGDWNNAATWNPAGVPTATESVTILAGDVVTTGAALTRNATTTVNGTFQLNAGGTASGTNFTYGAAGSLNFNDTSSYNVTNTDVFWPGSSGPFNVNVLQGGLTLNNMSRTVNGVFATGAGVTLSTASLTINGTCQINTSGFFTNTGPIYGPASTLIYNSGGNYGRGFEWIFNGVGTIGVSAGYPNNITIQNNTTLDYNNGDPMAKAMAGNLTIEPGATFTMNAGTSTALPFTVGGNITNSGTVILGNVVGADLRLGGNLSNTGTFNTNSRAIFFTRNGTQTVNGVTTISYVVFAPDSGSTTVQLISGLNATAPLGGNAIAFSSASDVFDINGQTLTIGTSGIANLISGSGTFKGSAASNLVLQGLGNVGTINFTAGSQILNNLTINRTAGAVGVALGSGLTINGTLTMSAGHFDLGNNALTLGATATTPGAGTTNFIISEGTTGAQLRRVFTAAGTYSFPIGDGTASANGSQYSPISVNLVGGTYAAGAYVGVSVIDLKHPNFDANTEFITRYWQISSSGITTPTTYTATGTYLDADVNTPLVEANYQGNNWNGTTWLNNGAPVGAAANSTSAVPLSTTATNQITCGRRDADININQAGTTILTGGTYNFGSVLVGATSAVVFTIQNLGQISLFLNAASPAPAAPFIYSTAYATGNLAGPSGTRTFTVTFTPTAGGTFTGSISIPNNDPTGGENPYVINFTGIGVVPSPEMAIIGNGNVIPDGNSGYSTLNNTDFGSALLGATITRTFSIENSGTAALTLSGTTPFITIAGANAADFSVTVVPATSVAVAANTTFEITFTPQAAGVRLATLSIANNDTDENPYNFNIRGTGTCSTITNTITPTSGPAGTEVLITSTGSLTAATVTFGGVAATSITPISTTQIKAIVPAGAVTGLLTTTNLQGCQATNSFTVITNFASGCEGGNTTPELFISEVTDATSGNLSYVELYNATGASINLGSYAISVVNNAVGAPTNIPLNAVTLANQSAYVVALGTGGVFCAVPGGNGSLANQIFTGSGVNFDPGGNDYIGLLKSGSTIDSWGVSGSAVWADGLGLGDRGADFKRKNNVTVPKVAFTTSDWDIADYAGTGSDSCGTNDYADIGIYNFIAGTPPIITTQPAYTPTCKATNLSVTATEGVAGGSNLVYQWYVAAPGSATWTALTDGGIYSGTNTASLSISTVVGLEGYQYYVQVRENTSSCYTASNATVISATQTSTWNGTTWSPAPPTSSSIVVINGNYDTAVHGSFECCSMTINTGFQVSIAANTFISVVNDLTVQNTASLFIADDGSLVMVENNGVVSNLGTTQLQRTTSPYNKFDYTYWSSPVTATTMGVAFPGWRTDYSFSFNTANYADILAPVNGFDDDGNAWQFAGPAAALLPGKGYAVMAPTTGSFPTTSTVTFSGTLNNGIINTPLALSANPMNANDDFVLVGNPYPSAIFANTFITTNTNISGTLYFWTHRTGISSTNPGPDAKNFITADYAMYNLSGGTSSGTGSPAPTGYVASGQGFFVEAVNATNLTFNNGMRSKTHPNNQFYRLNNTLAAVDRDRIWLNMEGVDGLFSQLLLGYFPEATMDIDRGYDGVVHPTGNKISLYSLIGADQYKIQGRAPFNETDLVPVGYYATLPGNYTISIGAREGLLNRPGQQVYLQDNLIGFTHDLTKSPYTFSTAVGVYNNRFVLKYLNSELSNQSMLVPDESILVYGNNFSVTVKSAAAEIRNVALFDVTGRLLYTINVNALETVVSNLPAVHQQLLVKIKLSNDQEVVRKVLL